MVQPKVTKIHKYDGQSIHVQGQTACYELGNYLGGGAAGVVYEAVLEGSSAYSSGDSESGQHFAVKILHPGGSSLHSCMTPHGPDAQTFAKQSDPAQTDTNAPEFFDKGLAFMFETNLLLELSEFAMCCPQRELDYQACWQKMPTTFDPNQKIMTTKKTNLMDWRKEITPESNGTDASNKRRKH